MDQFDVDLFVIGGGSGGVRAARVAAGHGARVAIAEEHRWGGTCVIRGCVPKKLLVYAAEYGAAIADARGFGWRVEAPQLDWPALLAAKDREIARLSDIYRQLLAKASVAIHEGRAVLVDAHTIEVNGRRVTFRNLLVATGGAPQVPVIPGAERFITSNEAFHLPSLPKRVAIVGGGYVAVEFAHIFAGLGSKVTVVHRQDRVLRGFDGELRSAVEDGLRAHGITVEAGLAPTLLEDTGSGLRLHIGIPGGDDIDVIDCDLAMAATGRAPATAGLGLAELGVTLDAAGGIVVDRFSQSSVAHIHAVGDVTHRVALTPVAILEGQAYSDTVFGKRPTPVDHDLIPTAVFAQPPAATVGLTEEAARARGIDAQVFLSRFRPLRHNLTGRNERSLIKLVVDPGNRRVLGVHMVGADAPEIIQAAAIAVTMGATKDDFDRTIAIHPTAAEELVLMRG